MKKQIDENCSLFTYITVDVCIQMHMSRVIVCIILVYHLQMEMKLHFFLEREAFENHYTKIHIFLTQTFCKIFKFFYKNNYFCFGHVYIKRWIVSLFISIFSTFRCALTVTCHINNKPMNYFPFYLRLSYDYYTGIKNEKLTLFKTAHSTEYIIRDDNQIHNK